MNKRSVTNLIIGWFLIICSSLIWNIYLIKENNEKLVLNKSKSFFEQIVVTRLWNSNHNGVYVPITKENKPNKYLEDSLRDVTTTDGIELTKVNPAYMTRQISELINSNYDLQYRMTSLNPLRPENEADDWETKALQSFEKGKKETLELTIENSVESYRYMAPLITQKSCLNCHAKQGYEIGDIRGGISLRFPADFYISMVNKSVFSTILFHLLIFITGFIGVLIFNKRLTRAYDNIERQNEALTESNATKDKFFSIIAHDLKNPFNSIIGFSNILVEKTKEKEEPELEKISKIILHSSERAMDLLNNLLVWGQTQTGKLNYKPEYFEIAALVKDTLQLLSSVAEHKSIVIENKVRSDAKVYADREMINAIIRNLLSNALKFTEKGGKITISISETTKHRCIVHISDEGVGIPPKQIEKIFMVAENHSTPGTEKETGTGLGLILCKEFVELNKGEIWVESTVGKGSTFSFSIPTKPESE